LHKHNFISLPYYFV